MKKTLRVLFEFLIGLIAIAFVAALCILVWPQILINRPVLAFALNHSQRFTGTGVHYSELAAHVNSISLVKKRLTVELGQTCVTQDTPQKKLHLCFSKSAVSLAYRFPKLIPELTELGPVTVTGVTANVRVIQSTPLVVPNFVMHAKLEPVHVDVEHFEYRTGDSEMAGIAQINGTVGALNVTGQTDVASKGKPSAHVAVQASARTVSEKLSGPWKGRAEANIDLLQNGTAHVKAEIQPSSTQIFRYKASAQYAQPKLSTNLQISGTYSAEKIAGTVSQELWVPHAMLPVHAEVRHCDYDYFHTRGSSGKIDLRCPIALDLPILRSKNSKTVALKNALQPEKQAWVEVRADFTGPFPFDSNRTFKGTISAIPGPVFGEKILTSTAVGTAELEAVPSELPKLRKLSARSDTEIEIPHFEKLVSALKGSALAIPAPFRALRGNVSFRSHTDLKDKIGHGSMEFHSDLASKKKTQRMCVDGHGGFEMKLPSRSNEPILASADADILLADVSLALPKFKLGSLPQLLPDTRLSRRPKRLAGTAPLGSKLKLDYRIHVATHPSHPVRLISQLTSRPVKVDLDLTSTNRRPLLGEIRVHQVPLHVAGISKGIGEILVHADTSDTSGPFTGEVLLNPRPGKAGTRVKIPPAEAAGQAAGEKAATRVPPQFSIPLTELASSILFGKSVNLVSVQPGSSEANQELPASAEPGQPILLHLRHRF